MSSINLPEKIGVWTRPGAPKRVEPQDIFQYMDGAGELYLGYRFRYLDVYRYTSPDQDDILVELYWMESPDDAYGLLSGDWGGEPVQLDSALQTTVPPRALYGAGLLRIWSDNLFARVLASQETDASRKAVYALGRAIVAGRANPPQPALVRALPATIGPQFRIQPDHLTFLRSHLVLNSVYFLSSENLLDLGPECDAVAASYSQGAGSAKNKPARLLLVRYPNAKAAEQALNHFRRVYLPEKQKGRTAVVSDEKGFVPIEDGWLGFARSGRGIALVFESPDDRSARLIVENSAQAMQTLEASRD